MIEVISFPESPNPMKTTVFLGGNTAKGHWQKIVQARLKRARVNVINTSRPDWDINPPTDEDKRQHIDWEMSSISAADYHFIFIPAGTKSPTVLLELGIALGSQSGYDERSVWVAVEKDYPWYDNVVEACAKYRVEVMPFDEALDSLVDSLLF